MRSQENTNITLGDLVAAVTEEVTPLVRDKRGVNLLVSYILHDLFLSCRVRLRNGFRIERAGRRQKWPAVAVGMLLFIVIAPSSSFAGTASDQLKQSVEKIQTILADPSLKGEAKIANRRQKLKEAVAERFDFDEMAKRSLGAQWQKRSPAEQQEFVRVFTELLETTYLSKLEEYAGEKIQFLNERQDKDSAEVKTKLVNKKGEEYLLDYRLSSMNGDWKVSDVVVENISLVNNYRSQFNRVLTKSSFEELVAAMKQKKIIPPASN
jgi:phospholipid transport system substrate-binding protein